jgi:outer membrane protein OmpA-like peptidoglycan-associated protein
MKTAMWSDNVREWQRAVVLAFLPFWLAAHAVAQGTGDVPGAQDIPGIARFPGAAIVQYEAQPAGNYRLALGRLQRVNGRVTAGREERLQGELTRITYQIPQGFSGTEVFAHFLSAISGQTQELFRCQGRACGSSNFWANDILGNRILYGPEQEQFYVALSSSNSAGESDRYFVLYVITRGNRSVYAQLDVLEPELADVQPGPESPQALLDRLQQDGSVIVRAIRFGQDDVLLESEGLEFVAGALALAPELRVLVVGHLRESGDVDALITRTQRRAQAVVEGLQQAGIDSSRLQARGAGPLAPVCAQAPCSDRVEIVLSE